MPMHDWKPVDANVYHHIHQRWIISMCDALNAGILPSGYSALVEQHAAGLVPDVLGLERRANGSAHSRPRPKLGGVSTRTRPKTRMEFDQGLAPALARRANRIAIRHRLGDVVCMIELVSPGNKAAAKPFRKFVQKTCEFLDAGVNVLVIDPFPPTSRDPGGIHKAIWDELNDGETPFELPPDQPLTMAAYVAGDLSVNLPVKAYVEPFAVGDVLRDMPAFLDADYYVDVPLERTYQEAWTTCPADMRYLVEHGRLPDE